jgi:hypothetical protein
MAATSATVQQRDTFVKFMFEEPLMQHSRVLAKGVSHPRQFPLSQINLYHTLVENRHGTTL